MLGYDQSESCRDGLAFNYRMPYIQTSQQVLQWTLSENFDFDLVLRAFALNIFSEIGLRKVRSEDLSLRVRLFLIKYLVFGPSGVPCLTRFRYNHFTCCSHDATMSQSPSIPSWTVVGRLSLRWIAQTSRIKYLGTQCTIKRMKYGPIMSSSQKRHMPDSRQRIPHSHAQQTNVFISWWVSCRMFSGSLTRLQRFEGYVTSDEVSFIPLRTAWTGVEYLPLMQTALKITDAKLEGLVTTEDERVVLLLTPL